MGLKERAQQIYKEQCACLGRADIASYDWEGFMACITHISNGGCVLLCVDAPRTWFKKYVFTHLNAKALRPPLPIVDGLLGLNWLLQDVQNLPLILNLLNLTYKNYLLWYVGEEGILSTLATNTKGLLWILQDGFLNPSDPLCDLKLLQLYKVFETILFESLLGILD
ncbi:HobA family DNA replication regulator [Helicobacter cynogastricus]|uniref:HobA family DNA replication regulator n=1 Tax=Helicobacter cynogastricus TaxID=329937 RepID=UPI000CF0C1DE|nr:HobA family DNA replication regulator [Helicobacter cynogastricus]